jgi:hypothetical protein
MVMGWDGAEPVVSRRRQFVCLVWAEVDVGKSGESLGASEVWLCVTLTLKVRQLPDSMRYVSSNSERDHMPSSNIDGEEEAEWGNGMSKGCRMWESDVGRCWLVIVGTEDNDGGAGRCSAYWTWLGTAWATNPVHRTCEIGTFSCREMSTSALLSVQWKDAGLTHQCIDSGIPLCAHPGYRGCDQPPTV